MNMRYRDMIPGAGMAGDFLERGKNRVVQKGKEVASWGVDKAIDGVIGGVRMGVNILGFVLMAMPVFQYKTPEKH